jgi:hypothetical protein
MNNVGEQHRHLLVLRRSADLCDRRAALVTELGVQWQLRATRPTQQPGCCHRTATAPRDIHVNIVSPLVSDIRHIAVPSPRRSFQTLVCRRVFRDKVGGYPCGSKSPTPTTVPLLGSVATQAVWNLLESRRRASPRGRVTDSPTGTPIRKGKRKCSLIVESARWPRPQSPGAGAGSTPCHRRGRSNGHVGGQPGELPHRLA